MAAHAPAQPMLAVKQFIPPVRSGAVHRELLADQLTSARTRLTLVVAPAGWGKTSLLSAWAREQCANQRVAWVSLDDGDDEPRRFWRYILSALSNASDEISSASLEALEIGDRAVLDLALPLLVNELASSAADHVLVLDDYHSVTDRRIHEAMEFLLAYVPPTLRIVIAGRSDPPLPLARLRVRGDLTELRAPELRFSPAEATDLVTSVSGLQLDAALLDEVWEQTEGWAAGLQLAALALRADPERVRHDQHVLDFFAAEVLPGLAPRHRDLLVRSAPLERLSGSLCDAALEVTGSAEVLGELDRADLFVAPLDGHEWYRCHGLLRAALLDQHGADPKGVLARAAAWFVAQDRIDDAVEHLLRADRHHEAAELLLQRQDDWFHARGEAAGFVRLGERLSETVMSPTLAYSLAYSAALYGDRDRVIRWLDRCDETAAADTAVAPGWHSFEAAVLCLRANFGLTEADSQRALVLARRSFDLETEDGRAGHPVARWGLGASLVREGQFEEAASVLLDLWVHGREDRWPLPLVLSVAGTLVFSLLEAGLEQDCDGVLQEVAPLAAGAEQPTGRGMTPGVSAVRLVEGRRLYQRGEVDSGVEILRRAVVLTELHPRPTLVVIALVYLAEAELAVGDRSAARAVLSRARDVAEDEAVCAFVFPRLDAAESRIGRKAIRAARRAGTLAEDLTDRELSILRALQGTASQREIGAALFLSINTIKAYNKSLYRKLAVNSRQEAVATARGLGLI
jgi:ATP/maltotriose-dependent transcriptional regulator MalT